MSQTAALQRLTRLAGAICKPANCGGQGSLWAQRSTGLACVHGLIQQQSVRGLGTGVSDMPDKTLNKARKLALAVGALAGAFGSLVGVGGGVLISPIIANTCKTIPQRVISGTSLAAVAATGSAAGYVYWCSGAVDLTSAAVIAATALATVPLGARATHIFDCAMLRRLMAYWLFIVAPLVPLKPFIHRTFGGPQQQPAPGQPHPAGGTAEGCETGVVTRPGGTGQEQEQAVPVGAAGVVTGAGKKEDGEEDGCGRVLVGEEGGSSSSSSSWSSMWRPLRGNDAVLAATGTVAGFASGLLGIGGGTIVTPLLIIATGLPQLSVLGTSLTAMIVPSLIGLMQHARLGNVDWLMAAGLAAGTLLGGTAGGRVAVSMPEGVLEWVFCAGMMYLGRKTLAGANATAAAKAKAKAAAAPVTGPGNGTGAGAVVEAVSKRG